MMTSNQAQPLLKVTDLCREFSAGEGVVRVLDDINLSIYAGEMVAIMGQSGSGKSTLMNILGCLDRPSMGSYQVKSQETRLLEPDQLAELRRLNFGFIFQRYHLLGDLTALGNVEVPAIYAGMSGQKRHERAAALLTRLGLEQRLNNRPSQLSGGQQQRVSIARALMNGGDVILADEPTGALDRHSGVEVMSILRELNAEGHTIIIVTHDPNIAAQTGRIIEISDGRIISDQPNTPTQPLPEAQVLQRPTLNRISAFSALFDRLAEAFQMALLAMNAHRMRTFLTMLGIIIGIASVVSVVALGKGSQAEILKNISGLGTNTITVYSGKNFGDIHSGKIHSLRPSDADALEEQPYVDSVSPNIRDSTVLRFRNIESNATLNGVGASYFRVKGLTISEGQIFNQKSVREQNQDVVIDPNTQTALFGAADAPGSIDPIGKVILLGNLPSRVIGVTAPQDNAFGDSDSLNVWLPYTTVMSRMLGQNYLRSIIVRIKDSAPSSAAEEAITTLLTLRHGTEDIFTQNSDSIRATIEKTTSTMTLLVSAIAFISLMVGGIGVMNIMLVSVTERTQEIGVRMAVGARQSDILQQFLIEAVLVCLVGGLLGISFALLVGAVFSHFAGGTLQMSFSTFSMIGACVSSSLIGVIFGFVPARNAARLDPIVALARE
jgi:macrolide transport system ATP-binding/permease protein